MSRDTPTSAERAEFEHWMIHVAKFVVGSNDPYPAGIERDWWRVWQASRAAMQTAEPVAPPVTPKHIEEISDLLLWPVTEDDARAARDMLQSMHFDLSMQADAAPDRAPSTEPKFDEAEFVKMVEHGTKAWGGEPENIADILRGRAPSTDSAADARDAARYRWLIEQIPCSISDDLECGISEIGNQIDEGIVSVQEARQSALAAMQPEGGKG